MSQPRQARVGQIARTDHAQRFTDLSDSTQQPRSDDEFWLEHVAEY